MDKKEQLNIDSSDFKVYQRRELPLLFPSAVARLVFLLLLAKMLSFAAFAGDIEMGQLEPVPVWTRWEQVLKSEKEYANPYRDVTLRVTFKGPKGQSFDGYGFWDGGQTFKIRAAFSVPGEWTWSTSCSETTDNGLNTHSGRVMVKPYAGANPIYQHGFLKVSDNRRYIVYADGKPFLWIGDTPWSAFVASTNDEWKNYLQNRCKNKFSVVQVHCGSGFLGRREDRNGNLPMLGDGDALQWNPAYWQGVEQKVQIANDLGLIVFICAVRQPGAGFPVKGFPVDNEQEVARFARNLAARLMGNFVVYSPVADDLWSPMADAAGNALDEAASQHLISAHPRFFLEPATIFYGKDYIDVVGLQTGEGWTFDPYKKEPRKPMSTVLAAKNAFEWPLDIYRRTPVKPVMNLEGPYDHPIEADGRISLPPRKAGYWGFLSGASGFTYGCFGIWNWGTPVSWMPVYKFQDALNLPSVTQMKHMSEFFSSIEWWTLKPHSELVQNQPADPMHKIGLAASADGKLAVAYLPDNLSVTIAMRGFSPKMQTRWFNPLNGHSEPAIKSLGSEKWMWTFDCPAGWEDAVLILKQPTRHR